MLSPGLNNLGNAWKARTEWVENALALSVLLKHGFVFFLRRWTMVKNIYIFFLPLSCFYSIIIWLLDWIPWSIAQMWPGAGNCPRKWPCCCEEEIKWPRAGWVRPLFVSLCCILCKVWYRHDRRKAKILMKDHMRPGKITHLAACGEQEAFHSLGMKSKRINLFDKPAPGRLSGPSLVPAQLWARCWLAEWLMGAGWSWQGVSFPKRCLRAQVGHWLL